MPVRGAHQPGGRGGGSSMPDNCRALVVIQSRAKEKASFLHHTERLTAISPDTIPAAEATGLGNPKGPAKLAADAGGAPDLARRSAAGARFACCAPAVRPCCQLI